MNKIDTFYKDMENVYFPSSNKLSIAHALKMSYTFNPERLKLIKKQADKYGLYCEIDWQQGYITIRDKKPNDKRYKNR